MLEQRLTETGIRAVGAHGDTGTAACGVRDGAGVHIYDAKAAAVGHKGRGKEPHTSVPECTGPGGSGRTRGARGAGGEWAGSNGKHGVAAVWGAAGDAGAVL
ncbi:unnamed protein product [Pneumocystis jirovecii]|uniref:Uncharacterized protein n=2 Tax=Pneumocystis jirovecii TaxID=42068 RepID=L0PED7_PNEJI|nr:pheromone receptor transcription factor [Pneumocystis jirovecii RU7]KTW32738.1 pheromone receptor transcription factor [Pneumocystis jirovecii RU7]CCJ30424.1 unnamed protein product [Pneumocystis jirovecii]